MSDAELTDIERARAQREAAATDAPDTQILATVLAEDIVESAYHRFRDFSPAIGEVFLDVFRHVGAHHCGDGARCTLNEEAVAMLTPHVGVPVAWELTTMLLTAMQIVGEKSAARVEEAIAVLRESSNENPLTPPPA
jgi:hypothetical protein